LQAGSENEDELEMKTRVDRLSICDQLCVLPRARHARQLKK